jgi:tetratricopeptide (TPR) repeat protein
MPLVENDQKHLTAAHGYVELGMWLDANAELEEIDPEVRHVPEVLEVRVQIYRALEKWELMQTVSKALAIHDPDEPQWTASWAYATRRADSIEHARIILVNAIERLPNVAIFHYNLACYECQLGDLEKAKATLHTAFKLEPQYRVMALDDEDLRPLWDEIEGI